jgi:uncharacterized protein YydD (DUF2326 family)
MKLHKLYCSDKRFKNIKFKLNGLNVIYADVQTDLTKKRNSHNLGKTKLAEIIDFMLLKRLDQNHFLQKINTTKNAKIFVNYTFYLEIQLPSVKFLTIKRSIDNNTKISFKLNDYTVDGFKEPSEWDFEDLPFEKAKEKLSFYLDFDFFKDKNYNYRKSLSYCLRTPPIDYNDVYKLADFAKGKDIHWKPFVFSLLGFDGNLLYKKYENDEKKEEYNGFIKTLEKDYDIKNTNRDYLVATKQEMQSNIDKIQSEIEKFNFFNADKQTITNQIEGIDNEINILNSEYYALKLELERIEKSLKTKFVFDLKRVEQLYKEAEIYFSESLIKDYNELLNFNKHLTANRLKYLNQIKKSKQESLGDITKELEKLNQEREDFLQFLTDSNSFDKFKFHQRELFAVQESLRETEHKIMMLDKIFDYKDKIQELETEIKSTKDALKKLHRTTEENQLYGGIRKNFASFFEEIMNEKATISWELNDEHNVKFNPPKVIGGKKGQNNTLKDEGTTYKKILCIVFDLAILVAYKNQKYYRFVYHDDALSQQDNGIKNRLLSLVHKLSKENDLQYIVSVIKADLPMNENDGIIYFDDSEIVLELNDKNEKGTLFGFEF